jgi:hypothetical protein
MTMALQIAHESNDWYPMLSEEERIDELVRQANEIAMMMCLAGDCSPQELVAAQTEYLEAHGCAVEYLGNGEARVTMRQQ